jgi:arylsulfatase A-like enzyme
MSQANLTRRSLLKAVAVSGAIGPIAGWAQPGPRASSRPNILLLIADQQHWKMMSAAGNRWVKTPAMDSIASTGVRFERAYSSNPVCLPSRFAMFTGRFPSAVGIRANESKPAESVNSFPGHAMGSLIRPAGYETVYGGKVHLPGTMGNITNCGFDRVLTKNEREGLAEESVKFLRGPHTKPFLMVGSFINPHDICYMAIRDYALSPAGRAEAARRGTSRGPNMDLALAKMIPPELDEAMKLPSGISETNFYAAHCPPLPANFEIPKQEPGGIDWLARSRSFRQYAREHWSPEMWRLHRWAYCRLTERVDAQLGQVLAALHETGLDQNTVVIFTSDHGDHDAAHRLEHKSTHYEESVRIPLMIRAPGQKNAGTVIQEPLVSTGLDLLPTVCDYTGVEPPSGLQGRSLRPFIEGKRAGHWRDTVFSETEMGYMVADHRYKYCAFDRDKSGEIRDSLVDLETDPGEMQNLAGRSEHRKTVTRLRAAMADWQHQNGIQFEIPA